VRQGAIRASRYCALQRSFIRTSPAWSATPAGVVEVNVNHNLAPELVIVMHGAPALHAGDFIVGWNSPTQSGVFRRSAKRSGSCGKAQYALRAIAPDGVKRAGAKIALASACAVR
jgi:hypothetical protein